MRVAIFAPNASFPPPEVHSVDRVMHALIDGLVELGQRVLVFAPASSKVKGELVPVGEFPVLLRDDLECAHLKRMQTLALKEVMRRTSEIDLVHAHSIDIPGVLLSTGLLTDLKIPNVTTLHSAIDRDIYSYLAACTNNIVACSESQWSACPTLNVRGVIYHGLDCMLYSLAPEPGDYLCFLGRFDPVKQPDKAIELAVSCGMPIKLAGGTAGEASRRYFQSEIAPFLTHPLVEYLGEIGFDEKLSLLRGAACNLHPTGFEEPFGLSVIEAGFCGTPTLAIRRGSMSEVIEDGKTGILVDDFVEGRHRVAECIGLDRKLISERNRERFDFKRMASNYLTVYDQILRVPHRKINSRLPSVANCRS
jgi:glycosyltransferase involved in cell wall biosynthesis